MIEAGRLNPGKLVSRTVSLAEASGVLESMESFGTLGVVAIDRF
ncbi:hypothetical protein [Mycobacterium sp. URHB0044]|nr:hypothetical protein [Mycobacterium sp. URHB0044]